jgi:hypothetical protein
MSLSPYDIWNQGHVRGKIDEFTIWDDVLTQEELEILASIVPVKGDMDGDGSIELDDLMAFAALWLTPVSKECVGGSVTGDFNADCEINLEDFRFLAENWE